jgi:hypothetical protein
MSEIHRESRLRKTARIRLVRMRGIATGKARYSVKCHQEWVFTPAAA